MVKVYVFILFSPSFYIAFRKPYMEKGFSPYLYRAVGNDSKLKLSHSTEKTAQSLEMLKSSKDANKTRRSIQNMIKDSKRTNKETILKQHLP